MTRAKHVSLCTQPYRLEGFLTLNLHIIMIGTMRVIDRFHWFIYLVVGGVLLPPVRARGGRRGLGTIRWSRVNLDLTTSMTVYRYDRCSEGRVLLLINKRHIITICYYTRLVV